MGDYHAVSVDAKFAFVSGQMPFLHNGKLLSNKAKLDVALGTYASRLAMMNVLLQLAHCEQISEIQHIVRLDGYFTCENGELLPHMLNGASNMIKEIFDNHRHARTVFGVNSLPQNTIVELVAIVKVK